MTDTLATQADTDATTHAAYLANGENKAAAARELGINASTVADRIKRHLARTAQDEASEPQAPYQVIAAETDSGLVEIARVAHIDISEPVTEDPDESLVALLEDGEPGDVVSEYADQMRAETAEALTRGEATYTGTVCPECDAVAYPFKGGHQVGCRYHQVNAGQPAPAIDPENAEVLAAGLTGGLAAAAERAAEVIANATEVPAASAEANLPLHEIMAKPAKAERVYVENCVKCGFTFSKPQTRTTCQSDKACQRRQAAKVAA